MSRGEWDSVMDVNARTAWEVSKAVYRLFPREQGGATVNVASAVGPYGNRGQISFEKGEPTLEELSRELQKTHARCNPLSRKSVRWIFQKPE